MARGVSFILNLNQERYNQIVYFFNFFGKLSLMTRNELKKLKKAHHLESFLKSYCVFDLRRNHYSGNHYLPDQGQEGLLTEIKNETLAENSWL